LDREHLSLEQALKRFFLPEMTAPFKPDGSHTVYTHKTLRLIGNPPPALFIQMKVFASRQNKKVKTETVPVFIEDGIFGVVQGYREVVVSTEPLRNEPRRLHPIVRLEANQRVDLSEYYNQPQDSVVYELVAVCRHSGDLGSGHYKADVKPDKHWYIANDTANSKNTGELRADNGYIYSFRRVESKPLEE
jgi:hypothetical protein